MSEHKTVREIAIDAETAALDAHRRMLAMEQALTNQIIISEVKAREIVLNVLRTVIGGALIREQVNYVMSTMVLTRELSGRLDALEQCCGIVPMSAHDVMAKPGSVKDEPTDRTGP